MVKSTEGKLVAVFDSNPEAAKGVSSEVGGQMCGNMDELLARRDVEGVIVATPGFLHAEHVRKAAAASKHVFCEKPMALTVRDCDDMIDACEEAGVNLMIGQVLRLIPIFKESARIVREELGRPVAMSTTRIGGWGYRQGWRTRVDQCGGMLLEVNVHEFDYLRHVLGEPEEAFAYGGRLVLDYVDFEDTVFASFRFRGGAVGVLKAAVSSVIGEYRGEIICQNGTLFYDNRAGAIRYRKAGSEEVTIGKDRMPPGGVAEEVAEFIASIRENRSPSITGQDGRAAVGMAVAVRRSIAERAPVPLGR